MCLKLRSALAGAVADSRNLHILRATFNSVEINRTRANTVSCRSRSWVFHRRSRVESKSFLLCFALRILEKPLLDSATKLQQVLLRFLRRGDPQYSARESDYIF